MNPPQPNRVRFGTFELDLRSGELRPVEPVDGIRTIVLQEQPFQVLRLLIERDGEVATREEIRKSLWPNDTAVDFNHSINVAIGTLRRALRDSAEEPKYIETVARRGYRLIAQIEWVNTAEEPVEPGRGDEDSSNDGNEKASPLKELGGGLIGKKILHYRVLEVIGGGGMGMVYKAEDLKLGRRVALKFLPEELTSDPLSLRRFEREAQTASSLNHANICTIHAIEEYEGQPFIVMELLEGETLRDRLAASSVESGIRPLPLPTLLEIAAQICNGLVAAHGKGIVHRDIKPANIFLTRQGPVKILDFGLAKLAASDDQEENDREHVRATAHFGGSADQRSSAAVEEADQERDASLTRTGMAIGTAGYMSPEQIKKERLDARTDLFSFGLVLYEMATGQRPFTGDTAEAVHQAILHQTPAPAHDLNAAVPGKLDAILAKALEKDRTQRYQSAADLAADLEAFQGPKHRRLPKWLTAAVLLFAVIAGGIYWRIRHTFKLSAQDTVVLADLDNRTSDPIFDDALNTALRVAFEQTPFLNLLAPDKVRGTLQLLHRPEDAKLTAERAREVCLRTHSRAVIASSIADAGNHFDLELDGIDCKTGRTIAKVKREAGGRNEIVRTLGMLGVELRGKMGEPRESLEKFSKPLEEATSSSLEALQLLSQGYRHHSARDDASTLYYQRAIELDPNLALAYVALGARYSNVGEMELASAAEKKAYERSDRLTGPAHFLVKTLYYDLGTGELEKAYPVHEQWVQTFPLDPRGHINFSFLLQVMGQYERAAAESRESVRLLPSVATYTNLIATTILANHLDEAKAGYDDAEARGMTHSSLHSLRHLVAFLEQDKPAMQEQLSWAMHNRDIGRPVFKGESSAQAYYGRFRTGAQWLRQVNDASRANPAPGIAVDNADFALQEAEAGSMMSAKQLASSLVNGPQDRDTRLELALLDARTGNTERAQQIADAISREFPLDTLTQNYSLPVIRAAIQLRQNDPAGAIESLKPAMKYDSAYPNPFNSLYPAYLRGLAYLQMNNGQLAKHEFQKVVDRPEVVGRFVTGALARLQLARAEAMRGDPAAALQSYQYFFSLWQDADPGIPILVQAKAEYTRLTLTSPRANGSNR